MRNILFKARVKSADYASFPGEWVQGCFCETYAPRSETEEIRAITNTAYCYRRSHMNTAHYLYNKDLCTWFEINAETLCECTGIQDKDKNLIFENDILLYQDLGGRQIYGIIRYGKYCPINGITEHIGFYVDWQDSEDTRWNGLLRNDLCYWVYAEKCNIIGNIFDNEHYEKTIKSQ